MKMKQQLTFGLAAGLLWLTACADPYMTPTVESEPISADTVDAVTAVLGKDVPFTKLPTYRYVEDKVVCYAYSPSNLNNKGEGLPESEGAELPPDYYVPVSPSAEEIDYQEAANICYELLDGLNYDTEHLLVYYVPSDGPEASFLRSTLLLPEYRSYYQCYVGYEENQPGEWVMPRPNALRGVVTVDSITGQVLQMESFEVITENEESSGNAMLWDLYQAVVYGSDKEAAARYDAVVATAYEWLESGGDLACVQDFAMRAKLGQREWLPLQEAELPAEKYPSWITLSQELQYQFFPKTGEELLRRTEEEEEIRWSNELVYVSMGQDGTLGVISVDPLGQCAKMYSLVSTGDIKEIEEDYRRRYEGTIYYTSEQVEIKE